jgi:hypothetical protein
MVKQAITRQIEKTLPEQNLENLAKLTIQCRNITDIKKREAVTEKLDSARECFESMENDLCSVRLAEAKALIRKVKE